MNAYLTVEDMAGIFGVSAKTIYRWAEERRVPHLKINNKIIRFDQGDVEEWATQQRIEPLVDMTTIHPSSLKIRDGQAKR